MGVKIPEIWVAAYKALGHHVGSCLRLGGAGVDLLRCLNLSQAELGCRPNAFILGIMSRIEQEQFVHDEEEYCPLCSEEFDLSDKCFSPCPYGYRVRSLERAVQPPSRHC